MVKERSWPGAEGSILVEERHLAKVNEWRLEVERPSANLTPQALQQHLDGARGHFVIDGGGPSALIEAVRRGEHLILRCKTSMGRLDVEVKVDPSLANLQENVVELFLFEVAGEIELS